VRMALGAPRAGVLGLVLRDGLTLAVAGLVLGLGGAVVLTNALGAMIFDAQPSATGTVAPPLKLLVDMQPNDVVTYLAVALTLILVALAACFMPARRAASVDPMVALRAQ